jgi:polyhydroxyalkanoate synthase
MVLESFNARLAWLGCLEHYPKKNADFLDKIIFKGSSRRAMMLDRSREIAATPVTSEPAKAQIGFTGFDQRFHASIARLTGGLSPLALNQAYMDWAGHLLMSPDKQAELVRDLATASARFLSYCLRDGLGADCPPCIEPLPQDTRFSGEEWRQWPFNILSQGFLLTQQWWHKAAAGVPGVTKHHEDIVAFMARQVLDTVSPKNFPLTNPEVIARTQKQSGMNFVRGARNFWEDWQRLAAGGKPTGAEAFEVGRNVAITPGKVVFRNRLIELIQYAPATAEVRAEPVLIVPAWIMKYYILDLSPQNSLVRYLVAQGYTVFMISWKNPGSEDGGLGIEDYRQLGVMAALDAVSAIVPETGVHTAGYCLGGTLLAVAAAAMARDGDTRVKSLTMFAAQTDFSEAGELTLFIDEGQVRFLEDMMTEKNYLDGKQMSGAFQLLRSNDLFWSAAVHEYLMGERAPMIDLMAWNADTTRLPYRMHSEYLRRFFLRNDLVEGRYEAGGKAVSLRDIHAPIFAVSTITDHVAPWRSVYKIQMLTDAEVTFVLSNGGHNAGIVNPPGHPRRHFQIATHKESGAYIDPDSWQASAVRTEGSWWPCWRDWLDSHSSKMTASPRLGTPAKDYAPLCDAPGTYVLEA